MGMRNVVELPYQAPSLISYTGSGAFATGALRVIVPWSMAISLPALSNPSRTGCGVPHRTAVGTVCYSLSRSRRLTSDFLRPPVSDEVAENH